MTSSNIPKPVYSGDVFDIVIHGRPVVQKNNIIIRRIKRKGKLVPFVDHTDKMKAIRNDICLKIFRHYTKLGYTKPIDYLIEAHLVFYIERVSEPDVENLPSIFFDAMEGIKEKKTKQKIAVTLVNDKLVRKVTCEKIVKGDVKYHGEPRTEIRIRRYIQTDH